MEDGLTGELGKKILPVVSRVEKELERKYVTENAPILPLNMAAKTAVPIRLKQDLFPVQWTHVQVSL